ncbi:MAG: 4Fe-4S dicluster domain-containing protein [Candidatus Bathyarchaeota archaeon]|nr:4Fe-4S dicluster domain-containing protein [Candidatus Bathyarchaeota archaeon]
MANVEDSIREIAQKLLSEKKVDLIIGYEQGTLLLRTTPCFVSKAEDVSKLVWNASCDANLSKYLVGREDKVGVVAKGCDARAIVVCTVEKQIPRENVVIIGVPCLGVIDRKKVEAKLDGKEALDAIIEDEKIKVKGEGFEYVLPREDFTCDSCLTCKHRNPPIYDVLVGEKASEAPHAAEFAGVSSLESKSVEERWAHFEEELGKCIRCCACRNVCPLCYCRECFVDQTMPAWFGKTNHLSDTMIYHIVRAFHVAGRCVDCGACSRACPMDIDLRQLVKKTERIVRERFNYEAGISLEEVPPLGEFKMQDPQEFIR